MAQQKKILPQDIVITLKPKKHSIIEEYAVIKVGDNIQKPDLDLLIYKYKRSLNYPITIYSIKTSLRERAGQSYRWKLLIDICTATDCDSIKDKYSLSYTQKAKLVTGFITANFYKEITHPQQKGMLSFFDYVYITKDGTWENPVTRFSSAIKDLSTTYK